jgi:hypothetical protein
MQQVHPASFRLLAVHGVTVPKVSVLPIFFLPSHVGMWNLLVELGVDSARLQLLAHIRQ